MLPHNLETASSHDVDLFPLDDCCKGMWCKGAMQKVSITQSRNGLLASSLIFYFLLCHHTIQKQPPHMMLFLLVDCCRVGGNVMGDAQKVTITQSRKAFSHCFSNFYFWPCCYKIQPQDVDFLLLDCCRVGGARQCDGGHAKSYLTQSRNGLLALLH